MNQFPPDRDCPTTDLTPFVRRSQRIQSPPDPDGRTLSTPDPTTYSAGEARILARFLGRTLAVTGNVARAASRGTFLVL